MDENRLDFGIRIHVQFQRGGAGLKGRDDLGDESDSGYQRELFGGVL